MTNNGFPNGYALIIGIGRDLPDTVNDAHALHKILIDKQKAGYPDAQVQLITEGAATKQGIIDALKELANQTKDNPNATVLIYYSGHGGQDLDKVRIWTLNINIKKAASSHSMRLFTLQ